MVPPGPAEKIRFSPHRLPKWARRSASMEALLPFLHLKGISTGGFPASAVSHSGDERAHPVAQRDIAAVGRLAS